MRVDGKVVLVTGGAHGIGRTLCERFVADGAAGVAVVDLDAKGAHELAQALGERAIGLAANVAREADVVSAVRTTEARFGPIDLMVSNAGIGTAQGVAAPVEVWQGIWDVNVMAHVHAANAVLPQMLERGEGYLLSTASAAGLLTQIGDAPYSVTKAAAVALAEWLAITYGDAGIKVSCLCPQGVDTDMVRSGAGSAAIDVVVAQGLITPAEVAEAVVQGLADERFLILPHPEVQQYRERKVTEPDRWIGGMRKLQRRIRDALG